MARVTRDEERRRGAERAVELVEDGAVIGIGTGSTVAVFIEVLTQARRLAGAVSSSERTSALLRQHGVPVVELGERELALYIDGADECDPERRLIKGGGGALTREKILAAASRRFVCLIDSGKRVDTLGRGPIPVEVLPLARGYVARRLSALGGRPTLRAGFVTDNGGEILDVAGLPTQDPIALEAELDRIAGVVAVGLFAARPADVVYCGDETI